LKDGNGMDGDERSPDAGNPDTVCIQGPEGSPCRGPRRQAAGGDVLDGAGTRVHGLALSTLTLAVISVAIYVIGWAVVDITGSLFT
jgi:hypothetical protein